MGKTLGQPPLPGDGAFLSHPKFKPRRPRKKLKTFLLESPGRSGDEVEAHLNGAGEAVPESFVDANRKEPTSLRAPDLDSSEASTIANKSLLSRITEPNLAVLNRDTFSFLQQPFQDNGSSRIFLEHDNMAPVTRAASLPPHLRNKSKTIPPALSALQEDDTQGNSRNLPVHDMAGQDNDRKSRPVNADMEQLRKKLAEDFGVNVSAPKPAALVAYPSSNDEPERIQNGVDTHHPTQSSTANSRRGKPSSRRGGRSARDDRRGDQDGYQQEPLRSSVADSARGKPTYRGRESRGGRQPRQSRWPTAAEQRPDPQRWEVKWESGSEASISLDSACANAGYGDDGKKKKKKKKKEHVGDGIDPDTGFKLTDWSGNWAPAPVDWDSRPAFRDGQSVKKIEQWLGGVEEEMRRANGSRSLEIPKNDIKVDGTTYYFRPAPDKPELPIIGDIAPRYWIPINFGQRSESAGTVPQAPQTFWSELIKSKMPIPYEEDDLVGARPWWDTYQVNGGYTLKHYEAPPILGIDPDENPEEIFAREQDCGSNHFVKHRKDIERAKINARKERLKNAQKKVRKLTNATTTQVDEQKMGENIIKPGIKLFIRSARLDDVPRIREIYNYYIDNSVCTPETVRRTDNDMKGRLADARYTTLPFLVAVERGGKVPARRKNDKGEEVILPDRVVGFAQADDYNDKSGMYRFTTELEVFTDKDKYMKGIAKCLLDKLLALLDPITHAPRGGYEVVGDDLDGVGAQRRISNLIINVPYDPDTNRLVWLERDLLAKLGFEKAGDLKGIGWKDGKSVNLAIFQRKTGEVINP